MEDRAVGTDDRAVGTDDVQRNHCNQNNLHDTIGYRFKRENWNYTDGYELMHRNSNDDDKMTFSRK